MKLAAQLFTLRDYCRTPDELFETLEKFGKWAMTVWSWRAR